MDTRAFQSAKRVRISFTSLALHKAYDKNLKEDNLFAAYPILPATVVALPATHIGLSVKLLFWNKAANRPMLQSTSLLGPTLKSPKLPVLRACCPFISLVVMKPTRVSYTRKSLISSPG